MRRRTNLIPCIGILLTLCASALNAASSGSLYVGLASVDITPDRPVALEGQMYTRISKSVHDPLTATALALETRRGEEKVGQVLMISADLCLISKEAILEPLRSRLRSKLPDIAAEQLLLNTTHTHTAPVTEGLVPYEIPKEGAVQPAEYIEFLLQRLAEAAISAWHSRKPALVNWGLGFAVVGHNRRAVYADGSARMYGKTDNTEFRRIEGPEDHSVQTLFFWTPERKLRGIAIQVPCPSQQVEDAEYISADFWADVRQELRKRHGRDLFVFAMTGASGDQSPHLLYRQRAESAMLLGRSLSPTQEIARRIANGVEEALAGAQGRESSSVVLDHRVAVFPLPRRMITTAEAETARKNYDQALAARNDPTRLWNLHFSKRVMDRFVEQEKDPSYSVEVHAIRIGDVAIVTNPFELFLEYGIRMEAQSPAEQTFVVQLSCGYAGYLPTAQAMLGGSYSTEPSSVEVGPEGGDVLVERTVTLLKSLWSNDEHP